jgi:hypothetical protein
MFKKLLVLLVISSTLGCHKKNQEENSACNPNGVCTTVFAVISINFTDKNGNSIGVQNFRAVNQRTHLALVSTVVLDTTPGYHIYPIVDDGVRSQLSTDGDDVLITATNPSTNQTKTVTLKLAGGCRCHVEKISGNTTAVFD